MPSGYTSGIVEVKIKTFNAFAKSCLRAFGAAIHMRDDPMDKEFKPRKVENYYIETFNEAEQNLKNLREADDQFFVDKVRSSLISDYEYYEKKLREVQIVKDRLESVLEEANKWTPPTKGHEEAKSFMVKQLEDTIRWDADVEYYENELDQIKIKLQSPIDISAVKEEMINDAEEEMKRAKERLEEEAKRCEDANEWATKFLKSIE